MGLDFNGMHTTSGGFGLGGFSHPTYAFGSIPPTLTTHPNGNIHGFVPGTFGNGLTAPPAFDYNPGASGMPSQGVSFTDMLENTWDFSGIDFNAMNVPTSAERSTSTHESIETSSESLPILPMPKETWSMHTQPQPTLDLPIPLPASTKSTQKASQRGPQKAAGRAVPPKRPRPQAPKATPPLPTRKTITQAAVPETQANNSLSAVIPTQNTVSKVLTSKAVPPTQTSIPPLDEPRASKRVPKKSRRNELANAIGTNSTSFAEPCNVVAQQRNSTANRSVAKRTGDTGNSASGATKYVVR